MSYIYIISIYICVCVCVCVYIIYVYNHKVGTLHVFFTTLYRVITVKKLHI